MFLFRDKKRLICVSKLWIFECLRPKLSFFTLKIDKSALYKQFMKRFIYYSILVSVRCKSYVVSAQNLQTYKGLLIGLLGW